MFDFRLDMPEGREYKILQLTDMQIIDSSQMRYPTRLCNAEREMWTPDKMGVNAFDSMERLIKKTSPDLILMTGDLVYGEFDDSGRVFEQFCAFMDHFGIPWAPVFGNHDNECERGVDFQCETFRKSKYCLFECGNVTGNGNYSIGLYSGEKLCRAIYMLDSNGCLVGKENRSFLNPYGIHGDQREYFTRHYAENGNGVPSFLAFHVPTDDFAQGYIDKGYQPEPDKSGGVFCYLSIGKTTESRDGDFGDKYEYLGNKRYGSILAEAKKCNTDGIFVGHCHNISTNVLYEGIRWVFGVKTGLYDYHLQGKTGGTLITLSPDGGDFSVENIYDEMKEM